MAGSQKNPLPGNIQLPHTPKIQKGQQKTKQNTPPRKHYETNKQTKNQNSKGLNNGLIARAFLLLSRCLSLVRLGGV